MFLKISQYSQGNAFVRDPFLNKVVGMKAATLLRRDSNTGVCEIFKNTFFHRTPTMAVSGLQKDFLTKKNH